MAISSLGIGSGIDISSLISGLVSAEGEPTLKRLESKEAGIQADISAFGSLKGALSSFQTSLAGLKDAADYQARSATPSDQSIFSASADTTAAASLYGIEVVQLAQAQKLISKDGYFSSGGDTVGEGTITFTQGTDSFDIAVASSDTLEEVRDAINSAGDNTGLTAAIINVDDGGGGTESKLVFTASDTGLDNAITITVDDTGDSNHTDANGLSRLVNANLDEPAIAKDGQIKVDGQLVSSDNDTFTGVISGVTINAHDVGAGETLTVALDKNAVTAKINSFISSYNELIGTFSALGSYDAETETAGLLQGDYTLRAIENGVRSTIFSAGTGTAAFGSLAEIGITTGEDGKFTLDASKLDSVLTSNFDDVGDLFAGDTGLATTLNTLVENYTKRDGLIDSRTSGLQLAVDDITDERADLEQRLLSFEARITKQFIAMDRIVSTLQSESSFLTQQLANLPGAYNPNRTS